MGGYMRARAHNATLHVSYDGSPLLSRVHGVQGGSARYATLAHIKEYNFTAVLSVNGADR